MGLFGGKKKEQNVSSEPGAHYVQAQDIGDENLPVAIPVQATVVGSAEARGPPKSITKTTVYPPDSKQPYVTNTNASLPQTETFVTTIPAPGAAQGNTTELLPGNFRRAPVRMERCPSCSQSSRTKVRTFPHIATWVACIILLILFWPICWIPLICDIFKQTDHYCSTCGTKVAEVTPFSDCCEKRRG